LQIQSERNDLIDTTKCDWRKYRQGKRVPRANMTTSSSLHSWHWPASRSCASVGRRRRQLQQLLLTATQECGTKCLSTEHMEQISEKEYGG
jgi:hypothetical protein